MANKTRMTDQNVAAFLATVEPESRRHDAAVLDELFRRVTGFAPRVWGESLVGYGRYNYRYDSGREGSFLATGFSPRKARLSIYILPGCSDFGAILSRLGKHRIGKSCLYVNKLEDIELDVLGELITAGIADLGRRWDVQPT